MVAGLEACPNLKILRPFPYDHMNDAVIGPGFEDIPLRWNTLSLQRQYESLGCFTKFLPLVSFNGDGYPQGRHPPKERDGRQKSKMASLQKRRDLAARVAAAAQMD